MKKIIIGFLMLFSLNVHSGPFEELKSKDLAAWLVQDFDLVFNFSVQQKIFVPNMCITKNNTQDRTCFTLNRGETIGLMKEALEREALRNQVPSEPDKPNISEEQIKKQLQEKIQEEERSKSI